jgi:SAM-dependent methyltransferase
MAERTFVDFGKAAGDYAQHRLGFPGTIMARLAALEVGLPGQRVLDLGTGTGLFAFEFAKAGCLVTGLDPSEDMLAKAKKVVADEQLSIELVRGSAEDTGLPDRSFDVVTAATSWHWFDRGRAAKEAMRLLKPGGRLVIAVLDWHFLPGNVLTKTFDLVQSFSPPKSQPNLSTFRYPEWIVDLTEAGFNKWELFGYVAPLKYSHEGWRGRVRASQGVGPVMDKMTLARFDRSLEEMLREHFPMEPMLVDHRIFALVAWCD